MENKAIKIINKIISWSIIILAGLIPLFFLPFTTDFYEFNKNALLFVTVGLLTILWLLRMALEGKIAFKKTSFDFAALISVASRL